VIVLASLLAPTLHPWYLLWLLPLLSFAPSPPWILWTGTVVLSYLDLAGGRDAMLGPSLVAWVEYTPVLALLLWFWLRREGGILPQAAGGGRCVELPGGP
jgi:hypothetical protein